MSCIKSLLTIVFICILCSMVKAGDIGDYLLPQPKSFKTGDGKFSFPRGRIICGLVSDTDVLRLVQSLQKEIKSVSGMYYPIAGIEAMNETAVISVGISNTVKQAQGYELNITDKSINITAKDKAGLAYALLTLKQLFTFQKENGHLPVLSISDWPDFERRGVMLDISRDKVPTMESLFDFVDQLSKWKINEIQLYTEHTFAYINHKTVWENASPLTADEIVELDEYCKMRFVSLVPNQNSFAHMDRWLKHDEYQDLAETPTSGVISPAAPGSLKLIDELYGELLPNFSSGYFNIGCDETDRLGTGKSKEISEKKGKGQVYLEFVLALKKISEKNGKKVQFWGDIILNHPEMIPSLPKDITAMIWGYEDNHPFDKQCAVFKNAKIDFYVCPGTSSWNSIIGRNKNAFENLRNAARNGKKFGGKGYLNTDWGDNGHWQPITVSQPAYLYGAAVSWGIDENEKIDVAHFLNTQLFKDKSNTFGQALANLGNAYLEVGVLTPNSNVFDVILKDTRRPFKENKFLSKLSKEKLQDAVAFIDGQVKKINEARVTSDDAVQLKDEIQLAADISRHACKQAIYKLEAPNGDIKNLPAARKTELKKDLEHLLTRYRALWVVRNRPGGLSDSVDKLVKNVLNYYQ